MSTTVVEPITKHLTVDCTPDLAFQYFTENIGAWWPLATHGISKERTGQGAINCVMEGRVGGRVYEVAHTQEEFDWGVVLIWEPGSLVSWTWHLSHPPEQSTQIHVSFDDAGNGKTNISLVHDHWENWGEEGAEYREGYNEGWDVVFMEGYAGFVAERA